MATNFLNKAKFLVKTKSPELLLIGGIVCMVGAVVTAVIATKKTENLPEEHRALVKNAKAETTAEGEERSEKEIKKEVTKAYIHTGFQYVKAYAPTAGLMILSGVCLVCGHNIQSRRLAGVSAAYIGLQEYIKRYELRNKTLNGEESHQMCKCGFNKIEEEGKTAYVPKSMEELENEVGEWYTDNMAIFSRETSTLWKDNPSWNFMTIQAVEREIQRKVNTVGWATVNDARIALQMKPTKRGMVEGWKKGCGEPVDFGFRNLIINKEFLDCKSPNVVLNFNIHGNIFALLPDEDDEVA